MRAILVSLFVQLFAAEISEPAPPSPFDRVATVAAGEPFEYTAGFSGTLFVWPAWQPGAPALVLHVDDATDDGDGGVRTPCVKREVEPGATLAITVTGASGPVELHLVAAPETEASRALITISC